MNKPTHIGGGGGGGGSGSGGGGSGSDCATGLCYWLLSIGARSLHLATKSHSGRAQDNCHRFTSKSALGGVKGNAMHAVRMQCEVLDVGKYSNPSFGPFSQVFGSVPGFFWLPKHLGCGIFELSTISP